MNGVGKGAGIPTLARFLRSMRLTPRTRYHDYGCPPEALGHALAVRLLDGTKPINRTWTVCCRHERLLAALAAQGVEARVDGLKTHAGFADLHAVFEHVAQSSQNPPLFFVMAEGSATPEHRPDGLGDAPAPAGWEEHPQLRVRGGAAGFATLRAVVADTALLMPPNPFADGYGNGARFQLRAIPEHNWTMARHSIQMSEHDGGVMVMGRTVSARAAAPCAGLSWALARLRPLLPAQESGGPPGPWLEADLPAATDSATLLAARSREVGRARLRLAAALEELGAPAAILRAVARPGA